MWLSRLALGLGIVAVLLLLACGPGVRFGLWPYPTGFLLLRMAVFVGGAAAVLSLAALLVPPARSLMALAALVLGVAAAAWPLELQRRARTAPLLNDVSTGAEIPPAILRGPPQEAFSRARAAAEAMGWDIVLADAEAGRIEAVATTFWFGFKDDVTVRVTPQGGTSRIDVRSKSRVGRGDAGTNARRIREYLKRVQ